MEGSNIKFLCKYFVTVFKKNQVKARREELKGGAEGSVKGVNGRIGRKRKMGEEEEFSWLLTIVITY